jgi:hypothetical protein
LTIFLLETDNVRLLVVADEDDAVGGVDIDDLDLVGKFFPSDRRLSIKFGIFMVTGK